MDDKMQKKRGRPLQTDQPRDKYVVIRVSKKEKEAILRCFKTATDVRDVIMKAVWKKIAKDENKPGN